jgi:hypothetical protein
VEAVPEIENVHIAPRRASNHARRVGRALAERPGRGHAQGIGIEEDPVLEHRTERGGVRGEGIERACRGLAQLFGEPESRRAFDVKRSGLETKRLRQLAKDAVEESLNLPPWCPGFLD